ncbi:MAG TPA: molecular chaperone DnaJ [Candidatus Baltobacteraceae bacterium]|jgi:molecular chaperone DnaJ|nr:molecular chaperone DnaJ [Candidatus Baltobacteraceae bacterium]
MATDFYSVLGVERSASEADIKNAYRALARRHHPDVARDKDKHGAEARFKEINEAYEVLSDPHKRRHYDRFGTASPNGSPGAGGFGGFSGGEGFGDIFDLFFNGMRAGGGARGGPTRGADLRYDLEIELHEAFTGVEREIAFQSAGACETCSGTGARPGTTPIICDGCQGSGVMRSVRQSPLGQFVTQGTCTRCGGAGRVVTSPCETCKGRGAVERLRTLTVRIPAGVDDGSGIRVTGSGEPGTRGGPAGDLYVNLRIAAHPRFRRDGLDLYVEQPISFTHAALGGPVEFESLDGPAHFTVPTGTQNATNFRIRGRGMPNVRGGARGDLISTVHVVVPTKLSRKERELLEEYARLGGDRVDERSFVDRVKEKFRAD